MRGGPPSCYSEDIDFVQINPEPIGNTLNSIRDVLDPWLGKPSRKLTERSVKLIYRFEAIDGSSSKLKIEINTTEHFHIKELKTVDFSMESEWFTGGSKILTYELEELMATKLRALYQRRKGRDLFDLWLVLKHKLIDVNLVISIFEEYCIRNNQKITRSLFIENLKQKRNHRDFSVDMKSLLALETGWSFDEAIELVNEEIISKLKN